MRPDLFIHTLKHLSYGSTAEELSEHVATCVEAAQETGKQAELTLKIKFKPEAGGTQMFLVDEIKTKLPKLPRQSTILFTTENGDLQRDDPRQMELPGLKEVAQQKPKEFKTAE